MVKRIKKIPIDVSKQRTLKKLREKGEEVNNYPIEESDLLRIDKCGLCESEDISLIAEVHLNQGLNFLSTSSCNNCLYTFRSVSPSLEWFKKRWKQIATEKLEVFNPEIEEIRERRYEDYHKILSQHLTKGHVLDIGSAYGTGARVFQSHGFEVEAIESEDDKANYLEKVVGIPIVGRFIEEFVLGDKKYDLIIFAHCLEHLDDPFTVMSNLNNILHPSGIVYLEVPILWNHVTWNDAFYLTHKSNFTEENLTRLVNQSGFEVLGKHHLRHTEEEPFDLGLVLGQNGNVPPSGNVLERNLQINCSIEDVQRLYRKNLPLSEILELDRVLRYSVDSIEHFYQTIRLDNKRIVGPKKDFEFISFETI